MGFKYDKIYSLREDNLDKNFVVFDFIQFYFYVLSDIVSDMKFLEWFEYWKNKSDMVSVEVNVFDVILFVLEVEYFEKKKVLYCKLQVFLEKLVLIIWEIVEESGGQIFVLDDSLLGINGMNEFNE